MSRFWQGWFMTWCGLIAVFGLVLTGGAFEATTEPVRLLLAGLRGPTPAQFDPTLRFSLAVMGAVTIGWAVTLALVVRAAIKLGPDGRPLWHAISVGLGTWFLIDSALSIATGFALNVAPNLALAGIYMAGILGSGVLRRS